MGRHLLSLASAILLTLCISVTSARADDWQECAYTEADNLVEQLIAACTRIINSGKAGGETLAAAYHHRAVGWFVKHDLERMIADLDKSIRLDPDDAHAFFMRGIGHRGIKNYDRAIADLSQAIRLNSTDWLYYKERGIAWYFKGDYDRAITDLSQAIRLDPKSGEAFAYRALSWAQKGDMGRANADVDVAKRLKEQ
jgi:tetratricopeptide (TPR) repeat protein